MYSVTDIYSNFFVLIFLIDTQQSKQDFADSAIKTLPKGDARCQVEDMDLRTHRTSTSLKTAKRKLIYSKNADAEIKVIKFLPVLNLFLGSMAVHCCLSRHKPHFGSKLRHFLRFPILKIHFGNFHFAVEITSISDISFVRDWLSFN